MRFKGGCEPLAPIDVTDLVNWITEVNRSWIKGPDRPYVEVDPVFLQNKTDLTVEALMRLFPGCRDTGRSITAINAGDYVPFHTDNCAPEWITRVHVPITTNPDAWFLTDALAHHLEVGMSYRVNPGRPHAVANYGNATRVHLMFDVIQ